MLYEISKELGAALLAQGCPFHVVYGTENTDTVLIARNRVVVEHGPRDGFSSPMATRPNPRTSHTRHQDCVFRVFGASTLPGAALQDHQRLVEQVVDMVVSELDVIAKTRKNTWSMVGGGFIKPPDLAKSQVWSGAVYEASFTFDRAISRRKWSGDIRPTTTLGGVSSDTVVTQDNVTFEAVS